MGVIASILPYVAVGLGVLVFVLLIALSVLAFLLLRREGPDWEQAEFAAALETPAVKSIPNTRTHWRAAPEPKWAGSKSADALAAQLAGLGFERIGAAVHSGRKITVILFIVPAHRTAAWIGVSDDGRIDLTVSSWTEDGSPLRVTTVKTESSFVMLPGEKRKVSGTCSPVELCRELAGLQQGEPLQPVTADSVMHLLNREERLRARRLTQDEETADLWSQRLLKTEARDGKTGDRISGQVLRSVFLSQLGDSINDCCLESFAENSRISAVDWARFHDRFLVIHDRLSACDLENLEVCDGLNPSERRKIRPFLNREIPAREAFAAINAELPPHLRYTEVGRVSDPVEATVYLAS